MMPRRVRDNLGGPEVGGPEVGQVVLPATPGGSPADRKWQVNVPPTRNNDLPYGSFGARRFCRGPCQGCRVQPWLTADQGVSILLESV